MRSFTNHYLGDKSRGTIEAGKTRNAYPIMVGAPEFIRSVRKSSYRREENVKGELKHGVKLLSGLILLRGQLSSS
jgi:hypothetical protein